MFGRGFRIVLLVVALVVLAGGILLSLRGFVVRNAVVTAELLTARAPIGGTVTAFELSRGLRLADDSPAVAIENTLADLRPKEEAEYRIDLLQRQIADQSQHLAWLDEHVAQLERILGWSLAALKLDLQLEHQQREKEIEAARARIAYYASEFERLQRLQGGAASRTSLEAAQADLLEAQARLDGLLLLSEQIQQRLDFLNQALVLSELPDQPINLASDLRRAQLARHQVAAELLGLQAELAAQQRRLDSEQRRLAQAASAAVRGPAGAVIWEVFVGAGEHVTEGEPLFSYVRCDRLVALAAVDDATLELVDAGHPVTISLYGTDRKLHGRVSASYGSSGDFVEQRTMAAHPKDLGLTDGVVLIDIEDEPSDAALHRLCDIGRTATISFEGIGLFDPLLNRL